MPNNSVQDRTLLAGLTKGRQAKITWLNATVPIGDAGQFTEINLAGTGYTTTVAGNRLTITFTGGSGTQAGIQFQDEGVNLGTSGTVNTLNIVGSTVVATRVGNVVTITVTAGTGTVTSVNASGGTTGLTFSGGPITGSGTLTLAGTLAIANGGTGATTALGARQNIDYEGALSFRLGRTDGAVLQAGFQRVFLLPSAYDNLTTGNWEIVTYPSSTCSIDIQYRTFGTTRPSTADSIVGATYPATTGSVTATGATSGWTTSSIAKGNYIAIQVLSNDLAREILFYMPGRKI